MKNLVVRMQTFRGLFARRSATVLLAALLAAVPFHSALAATAPSLGPAQSFAILGGSTVTNTGPSIITGDLGVNPGTAVTGFPPGIVIGGTIHAADAVALSAQGGTTTAYNNLAGQACNFNLTGQDLGGLTLVPGVYCFSTSAQLTGVLTLDAGGDPNAVWVFQIGSTLTTASNSSVLVINGGQQCNVYWQVGSSATLGTTTSFIGNILAFTSITLDTGANVFGRALARNGAATLDSNDVSISVCAIPPVTPIPPTLGKDFSPAAIDAGGISTLTITLSNPNSSVATLIVPLTDNLPSGVVIANPTNAGTTCLGSGGVTATSGGTTVTLPASRSIPANGSCTVTVNVTAPLTGSFFNSLPTGALQTSNGSYAAPAVATLTVNAPAGGAPTLGKAFSPATIDAGGVSTLTITLSNTSGTAATLTAPLIDTLPIGVEIAPTPNAITTCGGVVLATAGGSTLTLTGASILANSFCTVTVDVTAPIGGSFFNSLVVGALKTSNGENAAPAVATLTVIPPTLGLSLSKTPNPTTYSLEGQVIVYTFVLQNTSNKPLTGPFTITDDKLGTFTCGSATSLAPGASITCTKNYTIQAGDLGVNSLPTGVTATIDTGTWLQGFYGTQDMTITGAGPKVPNGIYPGWCIQDRVSSDLHNQPAKLYSTIGGSLPADVAKLSWNKVNYVLNHKIRGAGKSDLEFFKDVQTAIWVLLGEPKPEFGVSAAALQMINEAKAHPSFVPGADDIVAVIVYSDGMRIKPGSIQECIVEMRRLRTIVNHAAGSGTFGSVVVKSGQVLATVTQIPAPPANIAPTLNKAFSPASIRAGGVSILTITLNNPNSTAAKISASLTDYFPSGVVIANTANAGTTCGGKLTANKGDLKVILTGGSIPAKGSCKVTVAVTAKFKGSYSNKLPAGSLQTNLGNNATQAAATFTVLSNSWW
jgi:uncharacterized repeat protein (TIGR01451 family)